MNSFKLWHKLPSASSLERLAECPGSFGLSLEVANKSSEDADRGKRVHRALAKGTFEGLALDERDSYERCHAMAEQVIAQWAMKETFTREHEVEFFLSLGTRPNSHVGAPLLGTTDILCINTARTRALIIDYKTGHTPVVESRKNKQMRAYAVLVSRKLKIGNVTVVIVQPIAPLIRADYNQTDIQKSYNEISDIIHTAYESDARNVGDHCTYCPAQMKCPEFTGLALEAENLPVNLELIKPLVPRMKLIAKSVKATLETIKEAAATGQIDAPGFVSEPKERAPELYETLLLEKFPEVPEAEIHSVCKSTQKDFKDVFLRYWRPGEKFTIKEMEEEIKSRIAIAESHE